MEGTKRRRRYPSWHQTSRIPLAHTAIGSAVQRHYNPARIWFPQQRFLLALGMRRDRVGLLEGHCHLHLIRNGREMKDNWCKIFMG